jgi:hypothetical protein
MLPTLTVLDSFKRAPENPLNNGGKWAEAAGYYKSAGGGKIEGEKLVGTAAAVETSYWTKEEFTEQAVAVNVYGVEGHLNGTLRLNSCMQNPASEEHGYALLLTNEGRSAGEIIFDLFHSGVGPLHTGTVVAGMEEGDGIALWVNAGIVSVWHKSGAGAWTELFNVADSTYTKGYAGVEAFESNNGAFTDFSASLGGPAALTGTVAATAAFTGALTVPGPQELTGSMTGTFHAKAVLTIPSGAVDALSMIL